MDLSALDNHDPRIRYYPLMLERALSDLPQYELPAGYRFVFWRPGDRESWIAIEKSAKELESAAQGEEVWEQYYGAWEAQLPERMVFIENARGEKVATATAMFDVFGRDRSGDGWLHWVAVRREDQRRGLSKPLIAFTLRRLRALGYKRAKIPTQTTTWFACKIYLDFGFRPTAESAQENRKGWEILKRITAHPALAAFRAAAPSEVFEASEEEPPKGAKP